MRNYVFAFIVFIVSLLPTIVIAKENGNLADEIKQLLCTILNQKDIPAYIKKMGKIEQEKMEEKKRYMRYSWKVNTEMYLIYYNFTREFNKEDMDLDYFVFAIKPQNNKPIFQTKSDAKHWLAPFGTLIEDEECIMAVDNVSEDDGETEYDWEVSIDIPDLDIVRVEWYRNSKHTDRFCR